MRGKLPNAQTTRTIRTLAALQQFVPIAMLQVTILHFAHMLVIISLMSINVVSLWFGGAGDVRATRDLLLSQ